MENDRELPPRLRPLLTLLTWEGEISRARVMELFQLSPVRASEWIKEVRDFQPDWMVWDSIGRRYIATNALFRAGSRQPAARCEEDFASFLALTRIPSLYGQGGGAINVFPDFNVPAPQVFATLRRCIADRLAVDLTYRSMQNPEPHRRVIEPHTLVRAGRRWHVRGYCRKNQGFRDFALGRIVQAVIVEGRAGHLVIDDQAWSTKVDVLLVPHPDLAPEQAEVVKFENFEGTSARRQSCRAALAAYLIQDLRAATNVERQRPPDYQIAVANIEELKPWLFTS